MPAFHKNTKGLFFLTLIIINQAIAWATSVVGNMEGEKAFVATSFN